MCFIIHKPLIKKSLCGYQVGMTDVEPHLETPYI